MKKICKSNTSFGHISTCGNYININGNIYKKIDPPELKIGDTVKVFSVKPKEQGV